MIKNEMFNAIVLENNNTYYIINTVVLDGHKYSYLINKDDISNIIFCEILDTNEIKIIREKDLIYNIVNDIYFQRSFFLD